MGDRLAQAGGWLVAALVLGAGPLGAAEAPATEPAVRCAACHKDKAFTPADLRQRGQAGQDLRRLCPGAGDKLARIGEAMDRLELEDRSIGVWSKRGQVLDGPIDKDDKEARLSGGILKALADRTDMPLLRLEAMHRECHNALAAFRVQPIRDAKEALDGAAKVSLAYQKLFPQVTEAEDRQKEKMVFGIVVLVTLGVLWAVLIGYRNLGMPSVKPE